MKLFLTWLSRGYALCLAVAFLVSLWLVPLASPIWLAVLDAGIALMSIAGIFACLLGRQLLRPRFWKAWLPGLILWDVLYNLGATHWVIGASRMGELHRSGLYDLPGDEISGLALVIIGIGGLFVLPAYTILFMYAYHGGLAWEREQEPEPRRAEA